MMIGFVSAISASLAVIILITVTSLLAYIDSIFPRIGLRKINDLHYQYVMGELFVENSSLSELSLKINLLENEEGVILKSHKPICNYGFNRPEREMLEIVTFNYLKILKFYEDDISVQGVDVELYEAGFNYCYIDLLFTKAEVGEVDRVLKDG